MNQIDNKTDKQLNNQIDKKIDELLLKKNNNEISYDEMFEKIVSSQDIEFKKRCVLRGAELKIKSSNIYDLVLEINEPEFTKKCIKLSNIFRFFGF